MRILTTAGGNPTALEVRTAPLSREEYAARGAAMMAAGQSLSALYGARIVPEQAGFLLPVERHLEMAGGELCGNATLAAALVLGEHLGKRRLEMTTSDDGRRPVAVEIAGGVVSCRLTGLPMNCVQRTVDEATVGVVDLGGIVHVTIEAPFPADFRAAHVRVCEVLELTERAAVGVCWYRREGDVAHLEPVVRVHSAAGETFIHESACGSGSIALAAASGCAAIQQPTGEHITVIREGEHTTLRARVTGVLAIQES